MCLPVVSLNLKSRDFKKSQLTAALNLRKAREFWVDKGANCWFFRESPAK